VYRRIKRAAALRALIDALRNEAFSPQDRDATHVTIDVPADEVSQLRKLLRSLEAC
jgi:hypothetical protein